MSHNDSADSDSNQSPSSIRPHKHPQSLAEKIIIDKLASRFERDWLSTSRLSIEQTLQRALDENLSLEGQQELFRELLLTEFELIDRSGDIRKLKNYILRFPEFIAVIEDAFTQYQPFDTSTKYHQAIPATESLSFEYRYVPEKEIARGGMGIVLRGYDRILERPIAIKLLDPQLLGDDEALTRFRREPITCGNLQHPNIVPVYDSGVTKDGRPFFVMKLIGGATLAELLESSSVEFGSEAAIDIFQQVCHAIASAHRQGVIHRDIKPSNIMVADLGEVYVMDWGLSGFVKTESTQTPLSDRPHFDHPTPSAIQPTPTSSDSRLTAGGTLFGTPSYMPPEFRIESADRSNKRADVYSLGALLCELLVGKTPYQILAEHDPSLAQLTLYNYLVSQHVDPQLTDIVVACVQHDPRLRPESADLLARQLEEYRTNVRFRARQAELDAQNLRHRNRIGKLRFRIASLITSGLLACMALLTWSWQLDQRAKSQQMATAGRTLASALVAFNIACESKAWDSPQWLHSENLIEVAIPEVGLSKDPTMTAELELLVKQAELMAGLRDATTLKTDLKNNYFHYDNKEPKVVAAFTKFGIEVDGNVDQAVEALLALPDGAKQMVIGVLTQLVGNGNYEHQAYWSRLAPALEQRVLNTNLSAVLATNDVNQIRACVSPENLERYLPSALDTLGNRLRDLGEFELCEQVLRFACSKYPNNFEVNTSLGNFLRMAGSDQPAKALPFLAIASAIDPKPGAMLNYANCLSDCGEQKLADTVLSDLVRKYPNYYYASILLANVKQRIGDRDAAIRILEDSIAHGSHNCHTYLMLANLYKSMGRIQPAEQHLLRGRELVLHGNQLHAVGKMIESLADLGLLRQALDDAQSVIEQYEDAHIYFAAGNVASSLLEFDLAIEFYRKELEDHPDNAMAIVNIGFCLKEMGRFSEAMDYYVKGHQLGSASRYWHFPTMQWIQEITAHRRLLEHLPTEFELLTQSADYEHIRQTIAAVLQPAGKWQEAFELYRILEDNGQFANALPSLYLHAALTALHALAEPTEPQMPNLAADSLKSTDIGQLQEQKACQWLKIAAQKLAALDGTKGQIALELFQLRLFLQSHQSTFMQNPSTLALLKPDRREQLLESLEQLRACECVLLAKTN